jgi:hypothetical protein
VTALHQLGPKRDLRARFENTQTGVVRIEVWHAAYACG